MTRIVATACIVIFAGGCNKQPTSSGEARSVEDDERRTGRSAAGTGDGGTEAATPSSHAESCPGAEDGSELVGDPLPDWQLSDWANSEPLSLPDLRGRVVVVRFWTAGCPYCEKSMPALQDLFEEFSGEPVTFVGAFHGKPRGSQPDMTEPLELAAQWDVTFPLAFDRGWKTLRAWWLDRAHRHATSVTFVLGMDGRTAHVHPGPVFHPSDDPAEAKQNRDYLAVRRAIRSALRE